MSDLEDYGLELESDYHDKDSDPTPTKGSSGGKGIGGKVLAFVLGFVIGAGGVVGGVVGTGYWIVSSPVQDTLDTVNNITGADIDFSQYITPQYSQLKVMELVGELSKVASKFASGEGCLNDLKEISPYIDKVLDPLLNTLEGFGLSLNKEDLMAIPIANLPGHLIETAKDMKIVDVLSSVGANVDDPIIQVLCYTEDNQPVTIRTLMEEPSSLLHNIPLATFLIGDKVIDPETDGLLLSIAYGNSNRYVVDTEQNLVIMNAMRFTKEADTFYDIDGNEVTVTSENGANTVTVNEEKLYLKASDEENVYLAYEDAECTSPVYYKKVMLGDLMSGGMMDMFNTIELGSILNVSPLDENPDSITLALAYGEEGTHYRIEDGKIVWLKDSSGKYYKPRTIGTLLEGNITNLISDIKLSTLLLDEDNLDPDKDALLFSLCYGNKNRYTVVTDESDSTKKTVVMNPMRFTKAQDIFYDIDNTEVTATPYGNGYTVTVDEKTLYLKASDEENVYLAYGDADCTQAAYYTGLTLGDLLGGNMTDVFNTIELGSIFNVSPLDEDADSITLALAYGEEGTHYIIENGEIVWLKDSSGKYYKPRTIGTLLEGDLTGLISDIKLGTLFDISPLDEDPDPITLALAYGEEGTHYIIENGEIVWLGDNKPRTVGTLLEGNITDLIGDIKLGTLFNISPLDEDPDPITLALAYGEEGTHYNIVNGEIVWLKDSSGKYYKPRTVGDLLDGNLTDLISDIKLGTLFDISPLDEDPDPITLALAYGEEGTHYNIVNGEIVWVGDNKPRTVGDLLDGNMTDMIYDIKLGTLLNVNPLQKYDSDATNDPQNLMLALAYGEEGEHYEVVLNLENKYEIKWLLKEGETDVYHKARTVRDLIENADNIFNDLRLGTVLDINPLQNHDTDPDNDANEIMLALAYGYEGTHYKIENGKLVWQDNGAGGTYKPKTIKSLTEGDVFGELRLATVLGVKIDDPNADAMTHAIAFGYEGTDFMFIDGTAYNMDGVTLYNGYRTVSNMSNVGSMVDDLRLATVLGVEIDDPNADAMTHAIAFGYEGTHYRITTDEGNNKVVEWLPKSIDPDTNEVLEYYSYRTVSDMSNIGSMVDDLRLATVLGVEIDDPNADPITHAIAFGYEGTHFTIDGETVTWLTNPSTGALYSYRTVSDMSNIGTIIDDLRLGTVLDINPLQNYDTDPNNDANEIMLALAYGYEGTHYKIEGEKLVWMDNGAGGTHKPKTVKSLTEGDVFGELRLGTVLGVEIDDPNADAMTHAIAFGYEGTDFMFIDGTAYNMDGVTLYNGYRTVSDMSNIGGMVDDLRLATVLGIEIDEAPTAANAMTHAIAFGYEGTHFTIDGETVTWLTNPSTGALYSYRTVSDMSNMNNIINSLRIETALSIKPDPNGTRLLQVLAYGSNLTYTSNGDGTYSVVDPQYNTIADLSSTTNNLIDRLTISDILGKENIENDMLLSHLGNATLATLSDEIGNLTFKQIYPDQIYSSRTVYYDESDNAVLLYCKDGVYYTDSAYTSVYQGTANIVLEYEYEFGYKVNNGVVDTSTQITVIDGMDDGYIAKDKLYFDRDSGFYRYKNGDDEYQVHLVLTGQWKYLLVEGGYARDYLLTDFASLVSNMTKNMTQASLYDLKKDGIITALDADMLATPLISLPGYTPPEGKSTMGDLTITEILRLTSVLLGFLT